MTAHKNFLYIFLSLVLTLNSCTAAASITESIQPSTSSKVPVKRSYLIDYNEVYIPLGSSPIIDYTVPDLKPTNWLEKSCSILQGRLRAYLRTITRMGRSKLYPVSHQFFQVLHLQQGTYIVTRATPEAATEVFVMGKLKKMKRTITPAGFTDKIPNHELTYKFDLFEFEAPKFGEHIYMLKDGKRLYKHSVLSSNTDEPPSIDLTAYPAIVDWFISKGEVFILERNKVSRLQIDVGSLAIKHSESTSVLKGSYHQFCFYKGWYIFLTSNKLLVISPTLNPEDPRAKTTPLNYDDVKLEHAGFHHHVLTGRMKKEVKLPAGSKTATQTRLGYKRAIIYFVQEKGGDLVIKHAKVSTDSRILVNWKHYKRVIRTAEGLFTLFDDTVILEYLNSNVPLVELDRVAQNIIGLQTKFKSTVENMKLLMSSKANLVSYALNTINSKIFCHNPYFLKSGPRPSEHEHIGALIHVRTRKVAHEISIKFIPGIAVSSAQASKVTISPAGKIRPLVSNKHLELADFVSSQQPAHNMVPFTDLKQDRPKVVVHSKDLITKFESETHSEPEDSPAKSQTKYIVICTFLVLLMASMITSLPLLAKVAELRNSRLQHDRHFQGITHSLVTHPLRREAELVHF